MKYYLDTEFIEGPQDKRFLGIKYGQTKPTIDLISIGIVAEDGREYYAISKDFNFKEAWNRYQINDTMPDSIAFGKEKVYWIRENVLKPIFHELACKDLGFDTEGTKSKFLEKDSKLIASKSDFRYLKKLIKKHGKSNKQIAEEIKEFVYNQSDEDKYNGTYESKPEFYAYYADYDWVAFCWLFGKMIDLPKGFPWYCRDLKQILDEKQQLLIKEHGDIDVVRIKKYDGYPTQDNEHNALSDAYFCKDLHSFLQGL